MKLIRFGEPGNEKPGVIINDTFYNVSAFGEDYNESFFERDGLTRLKEFLKDKHHELPIIGADVRIGCPVARPSKIVCVGLNYAKHAAETNAPLPKEPILFLKSTTALSGPYDDVIIPKNSTKTDWEVELAVVIGKKQVT